MLLADDTDEDVRNWSLFALGSQCDADSPRLRELFVRHLDDPFPEAREEAIAGLAKRRDERAVVPLAELLEAGSYYIHHERDFEELIGEERLGESRWNVDDLLEAFEKRFPHLLERRDAERD
jgi:hypothetical protein